MHYRITKLSRYPAILALIVSGLGLAQAAEPLRITPGGLSPAGLRLDWNSQGADTAYTLQWRDSLSDSVWLMPVEPVCWPIAETHWIDPRVAGGQVGFYRLLAVPAAERGRLLSITPGATYATSTINTYLGLAQIPPLAQYPVRLYRVVYETITPWGARTRASGALCLPLNTGRLLPLLSYQHGTITQTNAAPSSLNIAGEPLVGVAFATTGYAAALPDYLGLGDSPGLHPYHHARSEATAAVDLLRAVRTFCATNGGFDLTNQVFLTGYSQGGHATLALFRELERFHTNEFAVTACAPMAGAYDLSGVTTDDFLSGQPQPNPYYFAYLLAAYQEVYHLAPTLADLLAPPDHTTLPPLLRGNSSGGQINTAIGTNNPVVILKPEYLAAFLANPNHPFRQALRENDLFDWTPRAPLQLYHCGGDQDVPYANSEVALASFQSRGVSVQLFNLVANGDHGDCVQPSLLHAKAWFDGLR